MDTRNIRKAVRQRPFIPFTLRLNDGREYFIPHPEYVAVSRRVVMVIDAADETGVWLEPILISSLKFVTGAPDPSAESNNGGDNA